MMQRTCRLEQADEKRELILERRGGFESAGKLIQMLTKSRGENIQLYLQGLHRSELLRDRAELVLKPSHRLEGLRQLRDLFLEHAQRLENLGELRKLTHRLENLRQMRELLLHRPHWLENLCDSLTWMKSVKLIGHRQPSLS
jgi:hypothetical protein